MILIAAVILKKVNKNRGKINHVFSVNHLVFFKELHYYYVKSRNKIVNAPQTKLCPRHPVI